MQQDRSTGWRLGTNRTVQFRYQVIGIAMGAVLAVALARLFMHAYPILTRGPVYPQKSSRRETLAIGVHLQNGRRAARHRGIQTAHHAALRLGISIGLVMEMLRKLIKNNAAFQGIRRADRAPGVSSFLA